MKKLIEYLFFRWKKEIYREGNENWTRYDKWTGIEICNYIRTFIDYKYTNKFDVSVKIKRKYFN